MKVAVLGAGAMGSLYGGLLAEAGNEVVLIDVWKDHIDAINKNGVEIEASGGSRVVKSIRGVSEPAAAGVADLLLVFVKATMTAQAASAAKSLVGPSTTVLTLQNGLGNVEALCEAFDESRVIAGTTGHGSTMLGPGHIRHAGEGDTVIGELDGSSGERIKALAALFEKAGIPTKISDNVMGLIWTKLLVNVGINALTAVTGLKNGRLLDFPETDELLEAAVKEACAVAQAKGIRLETEDAVGHARLVAKKTGANRSSMLQDVSAKRQTEISVINGAVAADGKKLGVPVPVNTVLTNLVLVRQKTYDEI